MKTLIIYLSVHHGNTEKIAKAMAEVLDAKLTKPSEIDVNEVSEYDLIGFGSGIYFGKHHANLLNFVDALPSFKGKKAFIFSTSGVSNALNFINNFRYGVLHFHEHLRKRLLKKGFKIVGEFNCRGYENYGLFKIIGGIAKGRPNEKDLENARNFAQSLLKHLQS